MFVNGRMFWFAIVSFVLWLITSVSTECNHTVPYKTEGWSTPGFNLNQHMQVELLVQYNITQYRLQDTPTRCLPISLYYSQDAYTWTKLSSSNDSHRRLPNRHVSPPVQARFIVFESSSTVGCSDIKLELYGCPLNGNVPVRYTRVSKNITGAELWDASQSPYIIDNVINIQSSGRLQIQPGVKVIFTSWSAGLTVYGTLEVRGVSENPVILKSASPFEQEASTWSGIEVDIQGGLSFEYVSVSGAKTGILGPISSMRLYGCHIHHNSDGIVLTRGDPDTGRVHISYTQITDNTNTGITDQPEISDDVINLRNIDIMRNGRHGLAVLRTVKIIADHCRISENTGFGMFAFADGVALHISNCTFQGNSHRGIFLSAMSRFLTVTINDSRFKDSQQEGMLLELKSKIKPFISIKNTEFSGNGHHGLEIRNSAVQEGSILDLTNNTFYCQPSSVSEYVYGFLLNTHEISSHWDVSLTQNRLEKCGMKIDGGLSSVIVERNTVMAGYTAMNFHIHNPNSRSATLSKNQFRGGDVIITTGRDTESTDITRNVFCRSMLILQTVQVNIRENSFLSGTKYSIRFDSDDFAGETLNCSLNYWDTTDAEVIDKQIYDGLDNDKYPLMSFIPFYEFPNMTSLGHRNNVLNRTVGGTVEGSLTLRRRDSPFRVTDDIIVDVLGSMVIEQGVTLLFPRNTGMTVRGTLKAYGEFNDPVVAKPLILGEKWNGVVITRQFESHASVVLRNFVLNDTVHGLEIRRDKSILENITSSHSSRGAVTVHVGWGHAQTIDIKGLIASHSKTGVILTGSVGEKHLTEITLTNCLVQQNVENGVESTVPVRLKISRCIIEHNSNRGITYRARTSMDIYRATFIGNRKGAVFMNGLSTDASVNFSLRESRIFDHQQNYLSAGTVTLLIPHCKNCSFYFENNLVTNNSLNSLIAIRGNVQELYIVNNTIVNNTGPILYSRYPLVIGGELVLSGNIVQNNHVQHTVLLDFTTKGSRIATVSHNTITSNHATYIIKLQAFGKLLVENNIFKHNSGTAVVSVDVSEDVILRENVFDNPLSSCELEAPAFERRSSINATMNYWGYSALPKVSKRICGFDTDMSKMFVRYFPCYMYEDKTEVSSNLHTDFWVEDIYGGVVDRHIDMKMSYSPYTIRRSIYIRSNGSLTIEGGTVVNFYPHTGIYVDGTLSTAGASGRVFFVPFNNVSWYGVVAANDSKLFLNATNVWHSENGLRIFTPNTQITGCYLKDTKKAGIVLDTLSLDLDLKGTVVEHGKEEGIVVNVPGRLKLLNGILQSNTGNGMTLVEFGKITVIENMTFANNAFHCVSTKRILNNMVLEIKRNLFKNCAVDIQRARIRNGFMVIEDNLFVHASNVAFNVLFENGNAGSNPVILKGNLFQQTGPVSVGVWGYVDAYIEDNEFLNCSGIGQGFLTITSAGAEANNMSVTKNRLNNIWGNCAVRLISKGLSNEVFNY